MRRTEGRKLCFATHHRTPAYFFPDSHILSSKMSAESQIKKRSHAEHAELDLEPEAGVAVPRHEAREPALEELRLAPLGPPGDAPPVGAGAGAGAGADPGPFKELRLPSIHERARADEAFLDILHVLANMTRRNAGDSIVRDEHGRVVFAYPDEVDKCMGLCRSTRDDDHLLEACVHLRLGKWGRTRLMFAAKKGDSARVERICRVGRGLLRIKQVPGDELVDPTLNKSEYSKYDVLSLRFSLLGEENEIPPSRAGSQGSALTFSAAYGHRSVMNDLLRFGADPDVALRVGHDSEIVQQLLNRPSLVRKLISCEKVKPGTAIRASLWFGRPFLSILRKKLVGFDAVDESDEANNELPAPREKFSFFSQLEETKDPLVSKALTEHPAYTNGHRLFAAGRSAAIERKRREVGDTSPCEYELWLRELASGTLGFVDPSDVLCAACSAGLLDMVVECLDVRNASADADNVFGNCAIHCAIRSNNVDIFKLLINRGADIEHTLIFDDYGNECSVLGFVCQSEEDLVGKWVKPFGARNDEILTFLVVERKAKVEPYLFCEKCEDGDSDAIKVLILSDQLNINEGVGVAKRTPLMHAARGSENAKEASKAFDGRARCVRILIEHGASTLQGAKFDVGNFEDRNSTARELACSTKMRRVIDACLGCDIDDNDDDFAAYMASLRMDPTEAGDDDEAYLASLRVDPASES